MFITEDFLLHSEPARRLYHDYAAGQPILDYHSHLSPRDIAQNRTFENLAAIWLEEDHYKWRAMRAHGVAERYITGESTPQAKYLAWASTVPATLGNPLYHWTHLELNRYFAVDDLLNVQTAEAVWHTANQQLNSPRLSVHGILGEFNVRVVCTTDDPVDDLEHHASIAHGDLATQVFPTFRPDAALAIDDASSFNVWTDRLAEVTDTDIRDLSAFVAALEQRHTYFHARGCRLSDHGLLRCWAEFPTEQEATTIFASARSGSTVDPGQHERFASYMMLQFARWDAQRKWTKQLHLGAFRNTNTRRLQGLGRDTGFDSIGDVRQGQALCRYLDMCESEDALPQMILYNSNPSDNYLFAAMTGNFQDERAPGKIQFGSAWWFADQKQGMEDQLRTLANVGLLSRFVGMLTDSRSFMSFPRHEYFRRVLCNLIGSQMTNGELPMDYELVGDMVRRICYENAVEYFRFEHISPEQ